MLFANNAMILLDLANHIFVDTPSLNKYTHTNMILFFDRIGS